MDLKFITCDEAVGYSQDKIKTYLQNYTEKIPKSNEKKESIGKPIEK